MRKNRNAAGFVNESDRIARGQPGFFDVRSRVLLQKPIKRILNARCISPLDHQPCKVRAADDLISGQRYDFVIADVQSERLQPLRDLRISLSRAPLSIPRAARSTRSIARQCNSRVCASYRENTPR